MSIIPTTVAQTLVKALGTFTPLVTERTAIGPVAPMDSAPKLFYLRRDSADPRTKINVFATDGSQPYVFERQHRLSTRWRLCRAETNDLVGSVIVSIGSCAVDFAGKPGLKHRRLTTKHSLLPAGYEFQLNDGATYVWDSATHYLERVTNAGGGVEEARQRLARATLLRRFSFDWEIQVDRRLDPEVALATVLAPLLTEWPSTVLDHTGGVRTVVPPETVVNPNEFVDGIDPALLVYTEPNNKSGAPRDFFNPPAFFQDKWIEG